MKVCFLVHNSAKDTGHGIDRYSYEVVSRFRREYDVTVLDNGKLNTPFDRLTNEFTFPFKLVGTKADVYHALSQQLAKAAVFTNKRPLVTTIHDLIPFRDSITAFYQKKLSLRDRVQLEYMKTCTLLAKSSDIIITSCEVIKRDIVSTLRIKPDKIKIVPYGVDTEFFRPLNVENYSIRKKQGRKVIFFIGGLSVAKGADILLKAFSEVLKKNKDVELWISGKFVFFDGMEFVKKLDIKENLRFIGYVPEENLPIYYNLADVVVLPSKIGFSFPVLEAMACRRPVITSDTPDIKEILGDSVLLVDPTNVEQLTERLLHILEDKSLQEKISHRGYQKARSLSWDITVSKTLDIYTELRDFF